MMTKWIAFVKAIKQTERAGSRYAFEYNHENKNTTPNLLSLKSIKLILTKKN